MKKIFLTIPGINGSDPNHWQSQWEKRYRNFKRVNQYNWDHVEASAWAEALENKISRHHHQSIFLIAHSMGCHTVAYWAARTQLTITGALLVAPPDVEKLEQSGRIEGFANQQPQQLPFKSIVIASTNDEYINIQQSEQYADVWGSEFINAGDLGHINSKSELGQWHWGLQILNRLQSSAISSFIH